MSTFLIVSGDDRLASTIESAADAAQGWRARRVGELQKLEATLADQSVSLVILHCDEKTDPASLDACVRRLREQRPRLQLLLVCDQHDAERELGYLRMGVIDCLTRPLDLRRLAYLIDSSTLRLRLNRAQRGIACSTRSRFDDLYQASAPAMRQVLDRVRRIASKDVPVLLGGETGAGKTYLAQLIHASSLRASRPFVSVNCGALQPNLIESELFGHQKGSFTGAFENHAGKFAHAQDGTLLLDDIDALTPGAQAKLLRALDERVYEPVGSNESLPVRARLIAGTNRSLEEAASKGEFRLDLFYRLNVIPLTVPPLKERTSEIRTLAQHFLRELSVKHGMTIPAVDEAVWQVFEIHDWPGNVRELRNAVEYAVTVCDGVSIGKADLPAKFERLGVAMREQQPKRLPDAVERRPRDSLARARQEGEYRRLVDVLRSCGNNRSHAAKELGISRAALYKKLDSFGITNWHR